jgi:hypothetical protein
MRVAFQGTLYPVHRVCDRRGRTTSFVRPPLALPRFQALAALLAAAWASWIVLVAWRYRELAMDDAYIGFRYVANLLAGDGFVFNPGAKVEGVTNGGWLLLLAPLSLLVGSAPLAAKVAGVVALLATLGLAARAAAATTKSDRSSSLAVLVALSLASNVDLVGFSLLGMETAALAAVLLAVVVLAERGETKWLPLLGSAAFTLHPEAVLVVPLGALFGTSIRAANGNRCLSFGMASRIIVASLLGAAAVTAARWLYFGSWLPNTFAAKPASTDGVIDQLVSVLSGSATNLGTPFSAPWALALAAWGAVTSLWAARDAGSSRALAFSLAALTTGFAFALYARPDWTGFGRYFAPYAPVALLFFWRGVLDLERRVTSAVAPRWRSGLAASLLAAWMALTGASTLLEWSSQRFRQGFPGYVMTSSSLVQPAQWLHRNIPTTAVVASRRIGVLGYEGRFEVFDDCFGLTEPEVARLVRQRGAPIDLPSDPSLDDLWQSRTPDFLLEDELIIQALPWVNFDVVEIHGLRYRRVRSFRIAKGVDWVLLGRVGLGPAVR